MCCFEKRRFAETILAYHSSCCRVVSIDLDEKESLHICGFLSGVHCIFVTYGLHTKNVINNHKVEAERWFFQEEEDLVVNRFLMHEYCSKFQQY